MNEDKAFWNSIEKSSRAGNLTQQIFALKQSLSDWSAEELLGFIRSFYNNWWRAYSFDLWAVAYIAFEGCSDSGFEEFRAWLVSRGQKEFERALVDLEYVARAAKEELTPEVLDSGAMEDFLLLPRNLYRQRFGRNPFDLLDDNVYTYSKHPVVGVQWSESELCKRYGQVCRIFGRTAADFEDSSPLEN